MHVYINMVNIFILEHLGWFKWNLCDLCVYFLGEFPWYSQVFSAIPWKFRSWRQPQGEARRAAGTLQLRGQTSAFRLDGLDGGFHSHGGTPWWMVYKGKYHLEMDDDLGITPICGNPQMFVHVSACWPRYLMHVHLSVFFDLPTWIWGQTMQDNASADGANLTSRCENTMRIHADPCGQVGPTRLTLHDFAIGTGQN